MEIYKTILGISPGCVVHAESTSSPIAAPSGFARVANAVALVRPFSENHKSLYLVGAARAKGCARPSNNCPNITKPKMPLSALVPA